MRAARAEFEKAWTAPRCGRARRSAGWLRSASSLTLAALLGFPAMAQVTAAGGAADTGTVVGGPSPYTVSGGTQTGPNLFHSFQDFSLATGESATFTDTPNPSVDLIFARVVGGNVSDLDGAITVDSAAYPGASFFFANPAGVIMREGFQFNGAGGDLHITTAREIAFADAIRWSTDATGDNTLTAAAPVAFGFLNASPSGDVVADLTTPGDNVAQYTSPSEVLVMSLVGDDVTLIGDSDQDQIRTEATSLTIAAMGSSTQDFLLSTLAPTASAGGVALMDTASINHDLAGDSASPLTLHADAFTLRNTLPPAFSPQLSTQGGGDLVVNARLVSLEDAVAIAAFRSSGAAGDVTLNVTDLSMSSPLFSNGPAIHSQSFSGAGQDIVINASGNVDLSGASRIRSGGVTAAGGVSISSGGTIQVQDSEISTTVGLGAGARGNIILTAVGDITFGGTSLIDTASGSVAAGHGNINLTSTTGDISICAVTFGCRIDSHSDGAGNAGDINLAASNGAVTIAGFGSTIEASSSSTAAAGDVFVGASSFAASGGAINSRSMDGAGGLIRFNVANNALFDGTLIDGSVNGAGLGSSLIVLADTITLDNNATFTFQAFGGGDAGTVELQGDINLVNGALIRTSSNAAATGDAGDIFFFGGDVQATNGGIEAATFGSGAGGNITIFANDVVLSASDLLTAAGLGSTGAAGDIFIQAANFTGDTAATISSLTNGPGDAGDVTITTTSGFALLDGVNITAGTYGGSGAGGDVRFTIAGDLTVTGGTAAQSGTSGGTGGSGNIFSLVGGAMLLDNAIFTTAARGGASGDAGDILVDANTLTLTNIGSLLAHTGDAGTTGNAGDITVDVFGDLDLIGAGRIETQAFGGSTGAGGDIVVTASTIDMTGGGGGTNITSFTTSSTAGDISLQSNGVFNIANGAFISASTTSGVAGDVTITAASLVADNASLSSGAGGLVTIDASGSVSFVNGATIFGLNGASLDLDAGAFALSGATTTLNFGNSTAGAPGLLDIDVAGPASISGGASIFGGSSGLGQGPSLAFSADSFTINTGSLNFQSNGGASSGSIDVVVAGSVDFTDASISTGVLGTPSAVAGDISVAAADISAIGGFFLSGSFGGGPAGDIMLSAPGDILLATLVSSASLSATSGPAGNIVVTATNLTLDGATTQASLSAASASAIGGDAGDITLTLSGDLNLIQQGAISAFAFGAGGRGGAITITADDVSISGLGTPTGTSSLIQTGTLGAGGPIAQPLSITANSLTMTAGGRLGAASVGTTDVGPMMLSIAGPMVMDTNALIDLSSSLPAGGGAGGALSITADSFSALGGSRIDISTVSGAGGQAIFNLAGAATFDNAFIWGDTTGAGSGGDLRVLASSIALNATSFDFGAFGSGRAGSVELMGDVSLANSSISTGTAVGAAGDAGSILISGGDLQSSISGLLAGTSGSGAGGAVTILANAVVLAASTISAGASVGSTGDAGDIVIQAASYAHNGGTGLLTTTNGPGAAGDVTTTTTSGPGLLDGGFISAGSFGGTGPGGNVSLSIASDLTLTGGVILYSRTDGPGDAGDISLGANGLLSIANNADINALSVGGVSGDVTITSASLQADNSDITSGRGGLLSFGVTGAAGFANGADLFGQNGGSLSLTAGSLSLDASHFNFGGNAAVPLGSLLIDVAGAASMTGGASINGSTNGAGPGAALALSSASLGVNGGSFNFGTFSTGAAGSIGFDVAGAINFTNATVQTSGIGAVAGDAGDISISAGSLTSSGGTIQAGNFGVGSGGDITLAVLGDILLTGLQVSTSANAATAGSAGNIVVTANNLLLDGALTPTQLNAFSGSTTGGDAGDITVALAGDLTLVQQATLANFAFGANADGGAITITADDVNISGPGSTSVFGSFIGTGAFGPGGQGAPISITANSLTMNASARLFSNAGTSNAGPITLTIAGPVLMDANSLIDLSSNLAAGGGAGGVLTVSANSFSALGNSLVDISTVSGAGGQAIFNIAGATTFDGASRIDATTSGSGAGGRIDLTTGSVSFAGANFNADALAGSSGAAGRIAITTGGMQVVGLTPLTARTFGSGPGGAIRVTTTGDILLANGGFDVGAYAGASGDAGSITVTARNLTLTNVGVLSAMSDGAATTGDGGVIDVIVSGFLNLVSGGRIAAQAQSGSTGDGGAVSLDAATVTVDAGGVSGDSHINVSAGDGDAGEITIAAIDLTVANGGTLHAGATGNGNGGRMAFNLTGAALFDDASVFGATGGDGDAGALSLTAASFSLRDDAQLNFNAVGDGDGGLINVAAGVILIDGLISADAFGSGRAGRIYLTATETLELCGTSPTSGACTVRANSHGSGDAGVIVAAAEMLSLGPASILSASSATGSGSAGAVMLAGKSVALDGAQLLVTSGHSDAAHDAALVGPGTIVVLSGDIAIGGGSSLIADNAAGGSAGRILLRGGRLALGGAGGPTLLSASATGGSGAGGIIELAATELVAGAPLMLAATSQNAIGGDIVFDIDQGVSVPLDELLGGGATDVSGGAGAGRVIRSGFITAFVPSQVVTDLCAQLAGCQTGEADDLAGRLAVIAPYTAAQSSGGSIGGPGHVPGALPAGAAPVELLALPPDALAEASALSVASLSDDPLAEEDEGEDEGERQGDPAIFDNPARVDVPSPGCRALARLEVESRAARRRPGDPAAARYVDDPNADPSEVALLEAECAEGG